MSEELTQTIENTENSEVQGIKCSSCGKDVDEHDAKYFEGEEKDSVICLCDECIAKFNYEFEEATRNINWFRGAVYGIGAGLICGAIWYAITFFTNTIFSLLALGVGFVVAIAVSMGAGNKKGLGIQILSSLITLLTLYLSTGVCGLHQFAQTQTEPLGIFGSVFTILASPFLMLDLFGWVICLVGVYIAFAAVQKDKLKPVITK